MNVSEISVIVPSFNGVKKLPALLKALENQTVNGFELIVVLDGSTDGSLELLQKYNSNKFHLKVINQKNKGRAGARNAGADNATGNLLVFYDDDMRPTEDSLERHIAFHLKHPNAVLGGNQMENPAEAKTDFDRYRCKIRKKWNAPFKELTELRIDNFHLTAANFSVNKFVFIGLGGFDESVTDAEDILLAYKALLKEIKIYFDPENISWHDDFVTCLKFIIRRREYHKAYQELKNKVGNEDWIKKRLMTYGVLKVTILYFLSTNKMIKLIDKNELVLLPSNVRYFLYDLVITGLGSVFTKKKLMQV